MQRFIAKDCLFCREMLSSDQLSSVAKLGKASLASQGGRRKAPAGSPINGPLAEIAR
jgi:hypothetical protein